MWTPSALIIIIVIIRNSFENRGCGKSKKINMSIGDHSSNPVLINSHACKKIDSVYIWSCVTKKVPRIFGAFFPGKRPPFPLIRRRSLCWIHFAFVRMNSPFLGDGAFDRLFSISSF